MAPSPSPEAVHADQNPTRCQVLTAQIGLLYDSTDVGVAVTLIAASILARLQWELVPHGIILGWCVYMFLVSAARLTLKRRFLQTARSGEEASRWGTAFAIGAGLAGAGWGAAGILLYPDANLVHQVFLVFTLGGMMLGAAFLLAPRPEAFIAFILPTGLAPAARLLIQDGEAHLAMGLLAIVFTLATLIATARIHLTILSSLTLRFENHDLVNDLRAAKKHADELNAQLEVRVQERTAELRESTEHLLAEIAQREQIEEELLRARKLESLGVLAGGIAHDFNNFLTVVQGNIEMARMRLDAGDPVQEILDQTANACRRAAFLSSQLLTFAKGGTPVRRLISIADLVKDAVQLARAGTQTSIEVGIAGISGLARSIPARSARCFTISCSMPARRCRNVESSRSTRKTWLCKALAATTFASGFRSAITGVASRPATFPASSIRTSPPNPAPPASAWRRHTPSSPSTEAALP